MNFRKPLAASLALLVTASLAFGAAQRVTPTQTNGLPDGGVTYENDVDGEIAGLWGIAPEWLILSGGGTANALIATSDTSTVSANLAIGRPKSFWVVPLSNNTAATTIKVDTLGPYNVLDKDGNAIGSNTLVAGRLTLLAFDGSSFRLPFSTGGTGGPAAVNAIDNGRLTLSSGVFVPTTSITAATTVYWTPGGIGNQIALYDGISSWISITSAQQSIPLTTTQSGTTTNGARTITGLSDTSQFIVGMKLSGSGVGTGAVISSIDSGTQVTASVNSTASATVTVTFKVPASTVLDVFGYLNTNTLKLEFASWTNSTTRATALTTQDGIYVKTGVVTRRYLGTVATTSTDGQSEFSFGSAASGGGAANMLLWNMYNRRAAKPIVTDSQNSYGYTGGIRNAAGSATLRVTYVAGVAEDEVAARYQDQINPNASGSPNGGGVGVGLDSSSAFSGIEGYFEGDGTATPLSSVSGWYAGLPVAGLHYFQALEQGINSSPSFHASGHNASALTAELLQ